MLHDLSLKSVSHTEIIGDKIHTALNKCFSMQLATEEARAKVHSIFYLHFKLLVAYQANIHSLTHDTPLSSSEIPPPPLPFANPVHTWDAITLCKRPLFVSMVLGLSTCWSACIKKRNTAPPPHPPPACSKTKNEMNLPLLLSLIRGCCENFQWNIIYCMRIQNGAPATKLCTI